MVSRLGRVRISSDRGCFGGCGVGGVAGEDDDDDDGLLLSDDDEKRRDRMGSGSRVQG